MLTEQPLMLRAGLRGTIRVVGCGPKPLPSCAPNHESLKNSRRQWRPAVSPPPLPPPSTAKAARRRKLFAEGVGKINSWTNRDGGEGRGGGGEGGGIALCFPTPFSIAVGGQTLCWKNLRLRPSSRSNPPLLQPVLSLLQQPQPCIRGW